MSERGHEVDSLDLPDRPTQPLLVRAVMQGRRHACPCGAAAVPAAPARLHWGRSSQRAVRMAHRTPKLSSQRAVRMAHRTPNPASTPAPNALPACCPPACPQLADWNYDGYTDVLLVTKDGIWAWAQVGAGRREMRGHGLLR